MVYRFITGYIDSIYYHTQPRAWVRAGFCNCYSTCRAGAAIHTKVKDLAKEKIFDSDKPISQVAYELGFKYPWHYTRFFKNRKWGNHLLITGCSIKGAVVDHPLAIS